MDLACLAAALRASLALRAAALVGALLPAAGCVRNARQDPGLDAPSAFSIRWATGLRETLEARWKPEEFSTPEVAGAVVLVGVHARGLFALDRVTGEVRWRALPTGAVGKPLHVPDPKGGPGVIYVGAQDGALYALSAFDGKVRWRFLTKGTIEHAPVLAGGRLFFTSSENRLYALDADKGTYRWQYERESPEQFTIRGFAGPAVVEGNVCTGFSDGYLACVSADNGEVSWARSLAAASDQFVDVDSTPVLAGGVLYASSYSGGVYALHPRDGAVRWRFPVEGAGTLVPSDGRLFFAAASSGLHALDQSGRLLWRQVVEGAGSLTTPVLLPDEGLVVGGSETGLYVVDRDRGSLRVYFAPGPGFSAPPELAGRELYALSNGAFLYKIEL